MGDDDHDDDPAGEASREDCDAAVADCEFDRDEEDDQRAGNDDADFLVQDELEGPFVPQALPSPLDPTDGLPRHDVEAHNQGEAPPFAYDTVVCVEDDREFVEVWSGEETAEGRVAAGKIRLLAGAVKPRVRWNDDGTERERRVFKPDQVRRYFQLWCADLGAEQVLVRPRRERCRHYKRQVFANMDIAPGEFGHETVSRNCTARRSVGGAFLGLRDEGVYVCDYREPRDPRSEAYQDRRDAEKLRTKPHLRRLPLFGGPGEERVIRDDPFDRSGGNGIFGKEG